MLWTVVIPVKALPAAKSRLSGASDGLPAHAELVAALRADTVDAVRSTPGVARVLLVTDRSPMPDDGGPSDSSTGGAGAPVHVLNQSRDGLNGAVLDAADHATDRWPGDAVAVLVGDLPTLTAVELSAALTLAAEVPLGVVPDAAGTGTTMLTALPGATLVPQFGPDSARSHAATASVIEATAGLRLDVDTPADLLVAAETATLGGRTRAVLAARSAAARPS